MITIEDTDQSSRSRRSSSSSQSRKESNIRRSAVPPPGVGPGGRGRPEKAIYQPPRRESDRPTIEKMDAIRTVSQNAPCPWTVCVHAGPDSFVMT